MSSKPPTPKQSTGQNKKETDDCIYERLRSQVTSFDSTSGTISHIFFVFGASVCLLD